MSRVKLSEFAAKSLLLDNYAGACLQLESIESDVAALDDTQKYVVKVDQGVKKRGKQGLILLKITKNEVVSGVQELSKKGFSRFVAEHMVPHDENEERYVSFERTREGMTIHYSEHGGVNVEDDPGSVRAYSATDVPLPKAFVDRIIQVMNEQHLSFVEINPLIIRDNEYLLLDAAVLADSAGEYTSDWSERDVVDPHVPSESEAAVAEMNQNSPAAFSFRVLNPDGALWLILSGGGASITIADEAMNQGKADLIGNYGEYSGGPTTEESYLYTKHVLEQLLKSGSSKKAIVIAGGVANFTDVKKTFKGVIQALTEYSDRLREQGVKVFVRRGGPNETEGLAMMKKFLEGSQLFGSVHGSDILLTEVITEALEHVDA
jgi:succinyl-CoA synthetase beta subunit